MIYIPLSVVYVQVHISRYYNYRFLFSKILLFKLGNWYGTVLFHPYFFKLVNSFENISTFREATYIRMMVKYLFILVLVP